MIKFSKILNEFATKDFDRYVEKEIRERINFCNIKNYIKISQTKSFMKLLKSM